MSVLAVTNNPKRPGSSGSTSFRYDEVTAMCQLLDTLVRGGDGRDMVKHDRVRSVYGKFKRMKARLDQHRAASGADGVIEP